VDTPNMYNVEGDNNRLTPHGVCSESFFFSFRFRKCFFLYGKLLSCLLWIIPFKFKHWRLILV